MAKLVDIYNSEKEPVIKRRQLPLTIYDNLTVSGFMHFDITTSVDYSGIVIMKNNQSVLLLNVNIASQTYALMSHSVIGCNNGYDNLSKVH